VRDDLEHCGRKPYTAQGRTDNDPERIGNIMDFPRIFESQQDNLKVVDGLQMGIMANMLPEI